MSFRFGPNGDDDESSPIASGAHGRRLSQAKRKSFVTQETKTETQFPADSSYKKDAKEKALGITIYDTKKAESLEQKDSMDTSNQFAETEVIGIISIDETGIILFSNEKAQTIMQCQDLTGRFIHDFTPNNYFGTDDFRARHAHMIRAFFDRPFAGGRVLDPGTILRAKLQNGRLVPLNIGLEAKINYKTGKPKLVVAYITEAAGIIDQSKVEKMLARATLVVLQQFISQTILSAVSGYELAVVPPLRYNGLDDDTYKLEKCRDYSFNKLSTDGGNGEDYKLLLYVMSTAFTIIISVLPLFVNHMHDNDKDEGKRKKWTRKEVIKYIANQINDAQEYLSSVKIFRSYDIVAVTILVTMVNLFLLYLLKRLPHEYELTSVKQCEDKVQLEKTLSAAMSIIGGIPFVYFVIKYSFIGIVYGFDAKITPEEDSDQEDVENGSASSGKAGHAGHSGKNLKKLKDIPVKGSFRTRRKSSTVVSFREEVGEMGGCPFLGGTMLESANGSPLNPMSQVCENTASSLVTAGAGTEGHTIPTSEPLSEPHSQATAHEPSLIEMRISDVVDVEQ